MTNSKKTIEIDSFVPRSEIDDRYLDSPYYIAPTAQVGQEAFAVIRDAIREKGMVALGRVVVSRREYVVMLECLAEDAPTLVGIDHGFSFPLHYCEVHELLTDWPSFLHDFLRHWPTDDHNSYVDFVRDGLHGNGAAHWGDDHWRRLTEKRAGGAKSVFHFDVQGSVAKSTHAGIPWLHFIRQRLGEHAQFWPFDGWDIPAGRWVIAEVYPALPTPDVSVPSGSVTRHQVWWRVLLM